MAHYILIRLGECVCEVECACIGVCAYTMEDTSISYEYCVFVYLYHISDIVVREKEINKRRKEKGKDEGEERKRKRIEKLNVTQKYTL